MPETITTLTGFEVKPGTNAQGAYVLTTFTDTEGKKFKTFRDEVAEEARNLVGSLVVIDFEVKSRTWDGRTLTDNMMNSVKDAATVSTVKEEAVASTGSPVANRIFAFKAAVDLLRAMPEAFGDKPNFVGISKVADAIYDWAAHSAGPDVEPELEPEPEPELEPVTN